MALTLFLNVYITNHRFTHSDRGLLPQQDRLDIFKYMLSSLSCLPINRACINVGLDQDFVHREDELEAWIKNTFDGICPFVFHPNRAKTQREWNVKLSDQLGSLYEQDLVLFFCNDDHIFIDSNLDMFNNVVRALEGDKSEYKAAALSHWPEHLRVAAAGAGSAKGVPAFVNGVVIRDFKENEHTLSFTWPSDDSYQIVNAKLLRAWFRERNFQESFLPRPDGNCWGIREYTCHVPKRELVRHFEGYSTAHMPLELAPPLMIPDGFFAGEIKLLQAEAPEIGWTLFNPMLPYRAVDSQGADYKGLINHDVPLFWESRISDRKLLPIEKYDILKANRDNAIKLFATAPHQTKWSIDNPCLPPLEWIAI